MVPVPVSDDYRIYQEQLSHIADTLEIEMTSVIEETTQKLFHIVHSSAPGRNA